MARIKKGVTARQRHKKILDLMKGQRATRHSLYRRAHESLLHSLSYAYAHRRERKGDMRKLWIARINAACRMNGTRYGDLIHALAGIGSAVDRKVLADIAVHDPDGFTRIIKAAGIATA